MKIKHLFKSKNGEVPFSWVDSDFTKHFGEMELEIANPLIGTKLPRSMESEEIQEELKPDFVSPSEVWETLKGLEHDTWALFYVQGDAGSLLVNAHWYDFFDGWRVYAYPVSYSYQWHAGYQLFSRNSRGTGTVGFSDALTLKSLDDRLRAPEDWAMSHKLYQKP